MRCKALTLSVLFRLDKPSKWHAALEEGWLPEPLLDWLGVRELESLAEAVKVDWIPVGLFLDVLSERVGALLIEIRQPSPQAFIRQTIRGVLFQKRCVREGGFLMWARYWRRFLLDKAKRVRRGIREEVRARILFALGIQLYLVLVD